MFTTNDFRTGQHVHLTTQFANEGVMNGRVTRIDHTNNIISVLDDNFELYTIRCCYIVAVGE